MKEIGLEIFKRTIGKYVETKEIIHVMKKGKVAFIVCPPTVRMDQTNHAVANEPCGSNETNRAVDVKKESNRADEPCGSSSNRAVQKTKESMAKQVKAIIDQVNKIKGKQQLPYTPVSHTLTGI